MRDAEFYEKIKGVLGSEQRKKNLSTYFRGAVLIPLLRENEEISLVFELRSSQLSWQPGEICFPGGRIEESDLSPEDAALRETVEELGIDEGQIQLLGGMEPVLSPLGLILYPAVGYMQEGVVFQPNLQEVAEVFTVPLSYLLAIEPVVGHMELGTRPMGDFPAHLLDKYPTSWKQRKNYPVFFYQYKEYVIWGLTAQVLQQFLTLFKEI